MQLYRIEEKDIAKIVTDEYIGWLSNPKINKFIAHKNSTLEECKRYVAEMASDKHSRIFGIYMSKHLIGTVTISKIDYIKNNCAIGIMIGDEDFLHQGYGKQALDLVLEYIHGTLGITNVTIGCNINNIAAIKCYHKVGFKDVNIVMEKLL